MLKMIVEGWNAVGREEGRTGRKDGFKSGPQLEREKARWTSMLESWQWFCRSTYNSDTSKSTIKHLGHIHSYSASLCQQVGGTLVKLLVKCYFCIRDSLKKLWGLMPASTKNKITIITHINFHIMNLIA